jgi:hypothetical protein
MGTSPLSYRRPQRVHIGFDADDLRLLIRLLADIDPGSDDFMIWAYNLDRLRHAERRLGKQDRVS